MGLLWSMIRGINRFKFMNKVFYILILGVLLNSCTPVLQGSSPGSVIVGRCFIDNVGEALAIAQSQCQKHGKNAVQKPSSGNICFYECK